MTLALLAGCTSLPVIEHDDCGNGVVETGEDCDTFSPGPGLVCRDPGSIGECRVDCRAASDGRRPPCPPGWGCNRDAICRPPASEFEPAVEIEVGGVETLRGGDFDGDQRMDLLASDRANGIGQARTQLLYFDDRAALDDTRAFPKSVLAPFIHDVSGDGRSDFLFSTGRVGMILGRTDRSLVPETFGSYRIPNTSARLLAVDDARIQDDSALIVFASVNGVPGFYVPQGENSELRLLGETPVPPELMLADPAIGNVNEDPVASPCAELVFAGSGADALWVADACTFDSASEATIWRDSVLLTRVAIEPPPAVQGEPALRNSVDGAPQIVDMNGDGRLDVLVGVNGLAYVAYGDGSTLATAVPYKLVMANPDEPDPLDVTMPVTAGDFTGDGFVDFVFPNVMVVSQATPNSPLGTYRSDYFNQGEGWTVARIVDLNGNGKLDVIAAGRSDPNIDFLNGSNTPFPIHFTVPTQNPVKHIAVADLDGDLIADLAFVEAATRSGERDTVKIAYGAPAGPPSAPVTAARVGNIEALSGYTENGIGNLIVGSGESAPGGQQSALLTLLETAGDRVPLAPYTLTSFSSNGSTDAAVALGLAAGRFSSGRGGDVLALASDEPFGSRLAFWLGPEIQSSSSSPLRLDDLPTTLRPVSVSDSGISVNVMVSGITADLDGDGRDESVWLMPYLADQPGADGEPPHAQCGLMILRTPDGATTPTGSPPIVLDEPCTRPELLAVDADGDDHPDLVLLTGDVEGTTTGKLLAPLESAGRPAQTKKQLSILWNDGHGSFSADAGVLVSAALDSPLSFATLPATTQQPFRIVYVTDTALRSVSATTLPRTLGSPETLTDIAGASSVVAGDVDGDGIFDLAIAASGDVRILRAGLTP